ncbi:Helitron helicase [Phytophthora megakarya]|uniref:ATP-dependent DNA helicase n=1 Tax=Phytophthora megakarya TaxID=4795 RepID=A0A225V9T9_9STRA|nr:Helitron helicase [Phytophthora megakarya]
MMNRGCFETLDRTFLDIMKNESEPYGGKVIVCIRLTKNMRVQTAPDPGSAADLAAFSEFLLPIGEGRYPVNEDIG